MRIKVIFDKVSTEKKLNTGWGVSFLVDDKILFDTGEKGEWLLQNLSYLGIDINKIEAVVISHDHWDHWGGLWDLLKKRRGLKVYACPGFGKEFKDKVRDAQAELIEAEGAIEITRDIYITGEIAGVYHGKYLMEQAIVLKTKNGVTIITGCAHPGILKIVEKVKNKYSEERIYLVLGGFHLMESDEQAIEVVVENFKKMNVIKAGPTHCSGKVAEDIFREHYAENFVSIDVGQEIEV